MNTVQNEWHSRHASVVTLQGYLDQHNLAKTKRAIVDLVAKMLIDKGRYEGVSGD